MINGFPAYVCVTPDRLEIFLKDSEGKTMADILIIDKTTLKLSYVIISDDDEDGGSSLLDLYNDLSE
jgi:hypothetical protein